MKAYRIYAPHTIKIEEMDALPVGESCVKLKNLVCGITSSDLAAYAGEYGVQYPIIPGRQCVGFVSEVGSAVTGLARGNRVVAYPQASCHNCKACKDGRYYDCEKPALFGMGENGFGSDFSVVSADDVYAIPDRLKDEEAIFTEHTALAINVMTRLGVEKGEHIIIVGATTVGVILAQVAMYYQAVPIVVDMREDMLEVARAAGVYYTVNAVSEDVSKKILSLTGGHMADTCAFMTASDMPMTNIVDYCAKHGRVAIVGRHTNKDQKLPVAGLIAKCLEVVTVSECGKNYHAAINMLANHTVAVSMLPTRTVAFADVAAAFERKMSEPESFEKLLIKV